MKFHGALIGVALGLSGVAGLVNQVVWQRALKLYLGGSESLSAMVVVLVFMFGLGLGAAAGGRAAPRWRRPLLGLAAMEALLAALSLAVIGVLGLDLAETAYAVQRLALAAGLPLRATYGALAFALLVAPTVAMGATMPFASDGLQRQLGVADARWLPGLFFVNTLGAAAGAYLAAARLLPLFGQRHTLILAVVCNLVAALIAALVAWRAPTSAPREVPPSARRAGLSRDEWVGLWVGLVALAYEMLLFRLLALIHEPLPTTFATGLAAYLVVWSVGVAAAGRWPLPPAALLFGTAAALAAVPPVVALERFADPPWPGLTPLLFLPVLGTGWIYGAVLSRAAKSWGRDVGRYAAANTVGACLGVGLATGLGLESPIGPFALSLAATLAAVASAELGRWRLTAPMAIAAAGTLWLGVATPFTEREGVRTYWGRDGVVEIMPEGDVHIDGLWHTKLTDGEDHIGRPYSWLMATAAVLALPDDPRRALVIGAGVGITSVTLEGLEGLEIDGYEINRTLGHVLRDYPAETLNILDRPRVRWLWMDARTGMALNPTRYDLILSAPLHLRQAGSTGLLSTEYLALLKSRLEPGGVVAFYSNEGVDAQSWLIARTISEHFAHQISWYDGVVTIASDRPIELDVAALSARMQRPERLYRELAALDARLRGEGWEGGVADWYDGPAGELRADRIIVDDQPLIEYPDLAEHLVSPLEVR